MERVAPVKATRLGPRASRAKSSAPTHDHSAARWQRALGNRGVERLLQARLKPRLTVGAPDDPFEREADLAAERVLQPTPHPAPERPCAACASGAAPCPKCAAEEPRLRRKPNGAPGSIPAVAADFRGALGAGQALPSATRRFFEERFGADFGAVRVHTGKRAARLAAALDARAFALERDLVFGAGEYQPDSGAGRRLLAHELAHTLQPPRVADATPIRRRVSPAFGRIRDNLTYGLTDWKIFESEAHEVLMILKALNDQDLRDTVRAMEAEGLVGRLFGNVSEEDQDKEVATLERIHNMRVHREVERVGGRRVTREIVGPCPPARRRAVESKVTATQEWSRAAREAIDDFLADPRGHAPTAALLDRHFLHQRNAGALAEPQILAHARTIRDNFRLTEVQANPFTNVCASPFDPLCRALAAAYVSRRARTVTFCESFFRSNEHWQTFILLHELVHVYAGVRDRGYGNERIFAYLSPADAINNADSYALFAVDVRGVHGGAAALRQPPRDSVSDCSAPEERELRRRFAFAARMVTNALNVIGNPRTGGAEAETYFKTRDRSKLRRVIDRFKKIDEKFDEGVNFECESGCDAGVIGYRRRWGWTVHVCPIFFALADADHRTNAILCLAAAERLSMSLPAGIEVVSVDPNQTADQAYNDVRAYMSYARAITSRWWGP
jgi:hypothetical protein